MIIIMYVVFLFLSEGHKQNQYLNDPVIIVQKQVMCSKSWISIKIETK